MVNVKEMVYGALQLVHDNVSDSWPQDWEEQETIVYTEEDNSSYERCGSRTTKSKCRYRLDIFGKKSLSSLASRIDEVLAYNQEGTGLGLTRTLCKDDNNANYKHKIMRYECIVSEKDGKIFGIS